MISRLNLSLSTTCPAKCVYCPANRGQRVHGHMSMKVVNKALNDCRGFPIQEMQVGENGEALANPNVVEILRRIRRVLPATGINLTTNLYLCDERMTEVLLGEGLVNSIQMNVDGHDAVSYQAQKGLPYSIMMRNLRALLYIRDRWYPAFPVSISVLTLTDYIHAVDRRFGACPTGLGEEQPTSHSSFHLVAESLLWTGVPIRRAPVFAWAERALSKGGAASYQCPQLPRVEAEAFIAPNGDWYACCLDSNTELVMGNILESSIPEIADSPRRVCFIEQLKAKAFLEIGGPCATVDCCQVIG